MKNFDIDPHVDELLPVLVVAALALAAALFTLDAHAAPAATAATAAPTSSTMPAEAIVVQDPAPLRAAARDSAPVQAQLNRGEVLEIRGERPDHWQVWDHVRERGGFVRKSQLLRLPANAGASVELLAQLRLAGAQAGAEGLALGLAAAYVQAATPAELAGPAGSEALEAMGAAAERIADRASATTATAASTAANTAVVAAATPNRGSEALLDVAARYGLRFTSVDSGEGRLQVCYEGDAFRRVLALPHSPDRRARAALALTRAECADPRATPRDAQARDQWRDEVLARVDGAALPPALKNRVLMRRAGVAAALAFAQARSGGASASGAASAAESALADFAAIAPAELSDDDQPAYNEAAMRVNAVRWIAQGAIAAPALRGLALRLQPGADGETCVLLGNGNARPDEAPLAKRCTYGLVAPASANLNREGNALALAVQPLAGWRELWLFTRTAEGWRVDVLPPAAAQPGLGVAEFAGWVPGGKQVLVARESRAEGRYRRSFEVLSLATLATERQAFEPRVLGPFQRWADAGWTRLSPTLR